MTLILFFLHKEIVQFLWNFKIQIICKVLDFFLEFRVATNFIFVLGNSISNLNKKLL